MKVIFISLLVLFFVQSASSQNVFIYGEKGEKIYFQETDSMVQIKFRKNTDLSEQIRIVIFWCFWNQ